MFLVQIIPDIDVELKHFVEDEEEIAEKDTVTLQVSSAKGRAKNQATD